MSPSLDRSPVEDSPTAEETPYLFSTENFYRMVDLDILPQDNRAYLWDGQIFEKPINTIRLAATHMMILAKITRAVPSGWFCSLNNSLTIGLDRSPTPDLVVIRGEPDDYLHRRPEAADTGLVIEMAEEVSKARIGRRLSAYASAGIPACWSVNLEDQSVHVHELPIREAGRYASVAIVRRGESFPLILDRTESGLIAVSDLVPSWS